jgi:hypothetical protein
MLGLVAGAAMATVAMTACLTDPPPDLPLDSQPPTIVHDQLQPQEGLPITSFPTTGLGFVVPISITDPALSCKFSVFDEYQPYLPCVPCDADGGIELIDFTLQAAQFDPTECHTIKFTVGSSFSPADTQCQSGSDTAIWEYRPNYASCVTYDAGTLGDGAFPEASSDDALPIVPDSGDEP